MTSGIPYQFPVHRTDSKLLSAALRILSFFTVCAKMSQSRKKKKKLDLHPELKVNEDVGMLARNMKQVCKKNLRWPAGCIGAWLKGLDHRCPGSAALGTYIVVGLCRWDSALYR